jgi:outer membrane protein OmpA-like peptidoglycan-associated protein
MLRANRLLLAGVAIAVIGGAQAFAAPRSDQPIVLAQAEGQVSDAVAAAQAKVAAARAALEAAKASGQGVKEATKALREAEKELHQAEAAARQVPAPGPQQGTAEPAPQGAPNGEANGTPPSQPPAADNTQPKLKRKPPIGEANGQPAPQGAPNGEATGTPPPPPPAADNTQPPTLKRKPPIGEANGQPAPQGAPNGEATGTPPPPPPAADNTQPPTLKRKPPVGEANGQPAPQGAPNGEANGTPPSQPPAADNTQPPTLKRKPPIGEANGQPAPQGAPNGEANGTPPVSSGQAAEQPPVNPPPPPTANGQPPKFDPSLLKRPHPTFGEAPKSDKPVQLPKQEAQIPTGGEVNAGAGRTIVKEQNGQVIIRHNDADRFRRLDGNVDVQNGRDGITTTTVNRSNGAQVITITDRDGNILQRYRKDQNGQIEVLIGETQPGNNGRRPPPPPRPQAPDATFDFHLQLPPLQLNIPRDQYVVESSRASRQQLMQTFEAPPVERVERPYTLEEIRRSNRIREKVRRVDFDTVTFEFGSAVLPDDQIAQMQAVGEAMQAVLQQDPGQVFLIEGHTDAVGSDLANLALSDRRAETVAEILTYYFHVPPENLVSQGYGEQYLKIPTQSAERANRRVVFRNITSLMRVGNR